MTASTPTASVAHPLSEAFRRLGDAQPRMRLLRKSSLMVSEFLSTHRDLVVTGTVPQDEAYVVTLHLRRRPEGYIAAEGRSIRAENFPAGNAGIADLRMQLRSDYTGPFHYLSFYLTRAALDAAADDAGAPRPGTLRHRLGQGFADPVLRHLLMSLRPALAVGPDETSALYADHVASALVTHMASTYGELRAPSPQLRGGLAPWQERRAKELIDAHLDGALPLAALAAACELSVRHFTRAFRAATGQSPHGWLLERRVDKAQGLLELSTAGLDEIAGACGFANQSHFTRVFKDIMGTPPGAWRRLRRS